MCALCAITGACSCCCAASVDERVLVDAAACCFTSAWTTRSHRHRRELLHVGALPRLRGLPCTAVGYLAAPLAPRASGARVVRVGRAAVARDRWARYPTQSVSHTRVQERRKRCWLEIESGGALVQSRVNTYLILWHRYDVKPYRYGLILSTVIVLSISMVCTIM